MITNIRVNHRKEPLGIPWESVKLSFLSKAGNAFAVRILDEQGADVWNDMIPLNRISGFYPDAAFASGVRYTVSVSDEDGNRAEGHFETADCLDAPLITPTEAIQTPEFFSGFSLDMSKRVAKARLTITAIGLYRAFVNGVRVGNDYLTPYYNDYDNYLRYQTYDVTELVRTGDNALSVLVGNGWAMGRFGLGRRTHIYADKPMLAAKLTIDFDDGDRAVIRTGTDWNARHSVITENSIYDGEIRDDRRTGETGCPCIVADASYRMIPDFSVPVTEKGRRSCTLLVSPKGEKILDFGQEITGVVEFVCREKAGTAVTLKHGEILQDGCFYNANLRTAKAAFTYISDGQEKTVSPMFTFMGFRYALVEGMERVNPVDFSAVVLYSDLEDTLEFQSSDETLNQLTANTQWGQRDNFLDIPTDCPQRDERLGWTGDTQVFSRTAMYHMDCFPFYRKFLKDLSYEQETYTNGEFPMYVPSLRGKCGAGGAVWSDVGMILPWNLYMAYGDKKQLSENYPMMKRYADTLREKDRTNHLLTEGFTFGDWLALDGMSEQAYFGATEETFIRTVYYANTLDILSKAADALEMEADAEFYGGLAREVRNALRKEYFTESGRFALDTQTAYALALYFDITPYPGRTARQFYERLKKDAFQLKTGFTGTPLLLPVLFRHGMEKDAYRILFHEGFPGWFYAIRMGATTIWERWNSLLPDGTCSGTDMNSMNHYANGAVCEAVYACIAGLRCAAPGWKKAAIAPHPNFRVTSASLTYHSMTGPYHVDWQVKGRQFTMRVSVPHGGSAVITLPVADAEPVEIASGDYEFSCQTDTDFTRRFDDDPVFMDILSDPEGARIFRETMPDFYKTLTETYPEMQVNRISEMKQYDGFGWRVNFTALTERLKEL